MLSANLCHVLMNDTPTEVVVRNLRRLVYIARQFSTDEDEKFAPLLEIICEYAKKHRKCPNTKSVLDYADATSTGANSDRKEIVAKLFLEMGELDSSYLKKSDPLVLIDEALDKAKRIYHVITAKNYGAYASGSRTITEKDKTKRESTVEDAIKYLRKRQANDLTEASPIPAGILQENVDVVQKKIEDYQNDVNDRIKTGFPHIDNFVVIGPKSINRFIGILGFSGDGKSTFLHTLAYNIAEEGKNVLYVSLEHSPEELWTFLTFIHSHRFQHKFKLPPFTTWMQGQNAYPQLTPDDFINFEDVLKNLKAGGLKGKIDCQRLWTWDEILAHLEVNHEKLRYDAIIIDYIDHLTMPGEARYRGEEVKKVIHEAQKLTQEFDSQRGIVLISPMQANREGNKLARKAEEGTKRYSMSAINQYSEYFHDMDLIFSVFSDDKMKVEGKMSLETEKSRSGINPLTTELYVDPSSKRVILPGSKGGTSTPIESSVEIEENKLLSTL